VVVCGALFRVSQHLIGFVYLLELVRRPLLMVVVWVVLESKLTKSLLYFLLRGISIYTEDFIIISLYSHSVFYLTPCIPLSFKGEGKGFVRGAKPL